MVLDGLDAWLVVLLKALVDAVDLFPVLLETALVGFPILEDLDEVACVVCVDFRIVDKDF